MNRENMCVVCGRNCAKVSLETCCECEENVCRECVTICVVCEMMVCPECALQCISCKESACSDCSVEREEEASEIYCQECYDEIVDQGSGEEMEL